MHEEVSLFGCGLRCKPFGVCFYRVCHLVIVLLWNIMHLLGCILKKKRNEYVQLADHACARALVGKRKEAQLIAREDNELIALEVTHLVMYVHIGHTSE